MHFAFFGGLHKQVQVGFMDARGHAVLGFKVNVLVERTSSRTDILTAAVRQMEMMNCKFVNKNFMLCLPDGRAAKYLNICPVVKNCLFLSCFQLVTCQPVLLG